MQFVKVDEDSYDVRMNLDTIRRIGLTMSYVDESSRFDEESRDEVIGKSFKTAYANLFEVEVNEKTDPSNPSE